MQYFEANLTVDPSANLRRFSINVKKQDNRSYDTFRWESGRASKRDQFERLIVAVDWTQSG